MPLTCCRIASANDQRFLRLLVDEENDQVAAAICLTERCIQIFTGDITTLDTTKAQSVGQNLLDLVGLNQMFRSKLIDDLFKPDDAVDIRGRSPGSLDDRPIVAPRKDSYLVLKGAIMKLVDTSRPDYQSYLLRL